MRELRREQKKVDHTLRSIMGKHGEETENLRLEIKDQVSWKYSLIGMCED